jgi:hypothetical protein
LRILGLDPGGTTGWAIIEYDDSSVKLIDKGQTKGALDGFLNDFNLEVLNQYDQIVCESFTLREGIYGADLSPVYIIGALQALLHNTGKIVNYQEPKLKPLCDNDRLKMMGLYTAGQGHAMDAVRHAIIYLRNKKHLPTLKLGWK